MAVEQSFVPAPEEEEDPGCMVDAAPFLEEEDFQPDWSPLGEEMEDHAAKAEPMLESPVPDEHSEADESMEEVPIDRGGDADRADRGHAAG